jgi:hypothetical protein
VLLVWTSSAGFVEYQHSASALLFLVRDDSVLGIERDGCFAVRSIMINGSGRGADGRVPSRAIASGAPGG